VPTFTPTPTPTPSLLGVQPGVKQGLVDGRGLTRQPCAGVKPLALHALGAVTGLLGGAAPAWCVAWVVVWRGVRSAYMVRLAW